jgi:hypothetical protein
LPPRSVCRPFSTAPAGAGYQREAPASLLVDWPTSQRPISTFVLFLSARYPLTELGINPRLRLGYQIGNCSDLREVTALPCVLLNVSWTRDRSLELEVGAKWTERQQAGATETETDLLFAAEWRCDFYADGHKACGFVTACRK